VRRPVPMDPALFRPAWGGLAAALRRDAH
jgi:hypothetical protein